MDVDLATITLQLKSKNKSFLFLYPTLRLKGTKPIQTYMGFDQYNVKKILVCLFHKNQESLSKTLTKAKEHDQFDFMIECDGYYYIVFHFLFKSDLYEKVLKGQYSKIHGEDRLYIHWSDHKEYAEIALNPNKYYDKFGKDFSAPTYILKQSKAELASPPNMDNELISISDDIKKKLEEHELYPSTSELQVLDL